MQNTFNAVIFDLDGVITETSAQHEAAWRAMAAAEGAADATLYSKSDAAERARKAEAQAAEPAAEAPAQRAARTGGVQREAQSPGLRPAHQIRIVELRERAEALFQAVNTGIELKIQMGGHGLPI